MDCKGLTPMIDDDRKICQIASDTRSFTVGLPVVPSAYNAIITKIVVYEEPGQMGCVNYAAVFVGDFLFARIDLAGWVVEYEMESLP